MYLSLTPKFHISLGYCLFQKGKTAVQRHGNGTKHDVLGKGKFSKMSN